MNDVLADGYVLSTVHNGHRAYIAAVVATNKASGTVELAFQFAPPTENLDNKVLAKMVV